MILSEEWGLTEKGFYRPTYVELLNALEYKAREQFSDEINLTVRSPLGIFLRIWAWMLNILFSVLEDVYNSRFADTAAGHALYNVGKNIGLQLLPAGKASGYVTIKGDPDTVVPEGYLVATAGGMQYTVMETCVIESTGTGLALIQAVQTGPEYNAPAGTVIHIVNPACVAGVKGVRNDGEITGGRERETDSEYRKRYYKSVDYAGGINAEALRASILQEVEGVSNALVYENDSDEPDEVYGLPPHSFEAIIYGGLDERIGRVIYERKSAGIQSVGNIRVPVLSSSRQTIPICFTRPDLVKVYVRITNLRVSEDYAGDAAVIASLMEQIGGDTAAGIDIGAPVVYMQIPGAVTAVRGVIDFELSIGRAPDACHKENIIMGIREKAVVTAETVVIT